MALADCWEALASPVYFLLAECDGLAHALMNVWHSMSIALLLRVLFAEMRVCVYTGRGCVRVCGQHCLLRRSLGIFLQPQRCHKYQRPETAGVQSTTTTLGQMVRGVFGWWMCGFGCGAVYVRV